MNHLGCLAPNSNWLKQKGNVAGSMLGLLEEKQASGLLFCLPPCDFLLSLEPHQTSHQYITTSRKRQKEAGVSGGCVLSMRRLLPEALCQTYSESPWLEPDYRTIAEASLQPSYCPALADASPQGVSRVGKHERGMGLLPIRAYPGAGQFANPKYGWVDGMHRTQL